MRSAVELSQVANLTTGTEILSARRGTFFEVGGFTSSSLICTLPIAKVAAGQLISLSGHLTIAGGSFPFEATGKVLKIEDAEGFVRIEIGLRQFEKDLWARFLKSRKSEQDRVDLLFAKIKGRL